MIHGPQEECVQALRNGHLLGISPGGVREALFSDETYPLLWGKRKGFAQVALDSQVVGWLSSVEAVFPKHVDADLLSRAPCLPASHSNVHSECARRLQISGNFE